MAFRPARSHVSVSGMKSSATPLPRRFVLLLAAGLCLLLAHAGCGRAKGRPASSLSERDRATLDDYEQIRAALANDDLRTAKTAASSLAALLRPADANTPAPAAYAPAEDIDSAIAIDRARQVFKTLSAKVIPLARGVEGFLRDDLCFAVRRRLVQQKPEVDNPYLGKAIHGFGELEK